MLPTREEKLAWLEKLRQEYLIKTRERWTYNHTPKDVSIELQDFVQSKAVATTAEIVEKFNDETDEAMQDLLYQWLDRYADWMANNLEKRFKPGVMSEWCELINIKLCDAKTKELIKKVFYALSERQKKEHYRERDTRTPLACMLFRVDPSIFDGDATVLIDLLKHMVSTMQLTNSSFSHRSFYLESPKLMMMHLTVLLIEQIEPEKIQPDHEDGLYDLFMDCVVKIPTAREAFSSLVWEAMLVERSHRPPDEGDLDHRHIFRRLLVTGSGCQQLWVPFRDVLVSEISDESADIAFKRMIDAYEDTYWTKEKTWYEMLMELNEEGLLLIKRPKTHNEFIDYYKKLREDQERMENVVARRHLRYGFVRMLTMLALHGTTKFLRESGSDEVYVIALCYLGREKWVDDIELFEVVLRAMHEIHMQGEFINDTSLPVLKELYEFRSRKQQFVLLEWLDNESFEQKLEETPREYEKGDPGRLFSIVCLDITSNEDYLEDLPAGFGGAPKEVDKSISTIPE